MSLAQGLKKAVAPAALAFGLAAANANAAPITTKIDFEDLTGYAAIQDQYADKGVHFTGDAELLPVGDANAWIAASESGVLGFYDHSAPGDVAAVSAGSTGIVFTNPVDSIKFDLFKFEGNDVYAFVMDNTNNLLAEIVTPSNATLYQGWNNDVAFAPGSASKISKVILADCDYADWSATSGNCTVNDQFYKVINDLEFTRDETPTSVPEPGSLALLAAGAAGLGFAGRRRNGPSQG